MFFRFLFAVLLSCPPLLADVVVSPIFSDHAVLQKAARVPVWGKAQPGEKLTVRVNDQTQTAVADEKGEWRVNLDLSRSGPGPFTMTVSGSNTITISDVLVGEVWLASGQSNMEWKLKDSTSFEEEKARPQNQLLREFRVDRAAQRFPTGEYRGAWYIAGPDTVGEFSGVAYHFGERLQRDLKVPVGVIHSSWGGTPVEAWTDLKAIESVPDLKASSAAMRRVLASQPMQKAGFVRTFAAWVKRTGREDRPTADVAAFVNGDTADWVDVTLPGTVSAAGLPATGAIWFRRDVDVPAANAGAPFAIGLGPLVGFEKAYWNGQQVWEMTPENLPGKGFHRWLYLPANMTKAGKNTLAIRVYAPAENVAFPMAPRVDSTDLVGPWKAKAEYEFPDPPADDRAPQAPAAPPRQEDTAAYLFNGMIHPLAPYAMRGAIWYQGESNVQRAYQYRTSFPLMIKSWRDAWEQGDFSFYFCQLTAFQPKDTVAGESDWAELRESQAAALAMPKTGQAVIFDLGESADVHPRNKKDVGDRLARLALAKDYGRKISFSAPVYRSLEIKGDKAIVHFDMLGGKLVAQPLPEDYVIKTLGNQKGRLVRNSPQSELEGFSICGKDGHWAWAEARIEGDTVVVSSPTVPEPVAVRYAWSNNPTGNLFSADGLPVSPFRTDSFPATTQNSKY